MYKHLNVYCLFILGCLWQPFFLEASNPLKDEHKENKFSSINLYEPSPHYSSSSTGPLIEENDSKRYQQDLYTSVLESFQSLTPSNRKQVLVDVLLSYPELISYIQPSQWQSSNLVYEGLKKIDCKSMSEIDQKALFDYLKNKSFRALILKNAQTLQNDFIKQHINFEHIKKLNLAGCIAITDDILPILADKVLALESLNLSHLPKLKNFAKVSFFGKQEPYIFNMLRSLNLSHCKGLEIIKIDTPSLEKLKLEKCQNVKSFTFTYMLKLKHIDLRHVNIIKESTLLKLIELLKNISILKLEGCGNLQDKELWETFPYLMRDYKEKLHLSKEFIRAHLLKIKPLEELNLSESGVDIETLNTILSDIYRMIDSIKSLNLGYNNTGPRGAIAISENSFLTNLTSLNLGGNNIRDVGVISISKSLFLTNLSSLHLGYNNIGDEGAIAISESPTLQNLTSLNLMHNNIENKGKQALTDSKMLTSLHSLRF